MKQNLKIKFCFYWEGSHSLGDVILLFQLHSYLSSFALSSGKIWNTEAHYVSIVMHSHLDWYCKYPSFSQHVVIILWLNWEMMKLQEAWEEPVTMALCSANAPHSLSRKHVHTRTHRDARFVSRNPMQCVRNRFQSHPWLIVSLQFRWQWCVAAAITAGTGLKWGAKKTPGYLCCHCYKRSRLNGLRRMSKCQTLSSWLQPLEEQIIAPISVTRG